MCQEGTLYYGLYHVVEGNRAPLYMYFIQGGAVSIKFHSCSPSLADDPKDHKLNAKIRKGPAGLFLPYGGFVITPQNRKVYPKRAGQFSASINLSNI